MGKIVPNNQTLDFVGEPIAAGDSVYLWADKMPEPLMLKCIANGKELFAVSVDGKVTLSPDLDLSDVRMLEMPYLFALREIINTAIYDKERSK